MTKKRLTLLNYRPDEAIRIGDVLIKIKPNVEGRRRLLIIAPKTDMINRIENEEWDKAIDDVIIT